jgi:hypothetical protein
MAPFVLSTARMRRGFIVLVIAMCVATSAIAGTARTPATHRSQIEGRVVDREGSAVAGVTVIVRPVGLVVTMGASARQLETVTDAVGKFHLDGVPPGTYWFVAFDLELSGTTPAIPIVDRVDVSVRLDDRPLPA